MAGRHSLARCLTAGIDDVRLGLAEEYATGLLDSLSSAAAERLPSGRLFVTEAAHGLICSSPHVFGRLAGVLVELLLTADEDMSDQRAGELLRVALLE